MQRPYGFCFGPDGHLYPDANEYPVVQRARWLRLQGYTLQGIATLLTNAGFRNRAGGPFLPTQVWRMLRRDASLGDQWFVGEYGT